MTEQNGLAVVQPQAPATVARGPRLGLPTSAEIAALKEYGDIIVKSGLAPAHVKTAEAAIVIMRHGHQLGINEFTALQNMFVVGGKPSAMASLLHSLILRDHGGSAVRIVESSAKRCELECRRQDDTKSTTVTYTIEEAAQAGLKDGNWQKYPADMLFARCISRAGRQVFRDSTMGMYTPEEIGGSVIEVRGEVIDTGAGQHPSREAMAEASAEPEPVVDQNRFARLHAIGQERELDHDALHHIARFKFPKIQSIANLSDQELADVEAAVETAAESDLLVWSLDWEAEIAAAAKRGASALDQMGTSIKNAGVTSRSHPWIAAAFQAAKRQADTEPTDAVYRDMAEEHELAGMPAHADRFAG